jgi:hypothetical protein
MNNEKNKDGVEALASRGGTSPAKASTPPPHLQIFIIHYSLFIIHYSLFIILLETDHDY